MMTEDAVETEVEKSEPLISEEVNGYGTSNSEEKQRYRSNYIPLEFVAFCYYTIIHTVIGHLQFYLHARATEDYDYLHPSNDTLNNNTTDRVNTIQSRATLNFILIFGLSMVICLVPTLLSGTWGSWCGRRKPMVVSFLGTTVYCLITIMVVLFDANVYYICFGTIIIGICGYSGTILTCLFSAATDITNPGPQRTWRIVRITTALFFGSTFSQIVTGTWIEASGYLDILYFLMAMNLAGLVVIIIFVPETIAHMSGELPKLTDIWCQVKESFLFLTRTDGTYSRQIVILSLAAMFLTSAIDTTRIGLLPLFLLGPPLFWNPTKISLFTSIRTVAALLVYTAASRCLRRYLSEINMAILSGFSYLAIYLLIGTAVNDTMAYVAGGCGLLLEMMPAMLRSHFSLIVLSSEQGSMQSLLALCEVTAAITSNGVSGVIYNATVSIFPGLFFVFLAFLSAVLMGILIIISRLMKGVNNLDRVPSVEYEELK